MPSLLLTFVLAFRLGGAVTGHVFQYVLPGRHTSVCVLYNQDHNRQVRLRGRLGPFVSRVSWCCPIMVSSLLALLSLLVTHALHSRVELPPCQVPQTGLR